MKIPLLGAWALALACIAGAAASAELPRTDPATWSNRGYLQFRWGMGPGDVSAALRAPGAMLRTDDPLTATKDEYSPAKENYVVAVFGFEIGGFDMRRVLFGFANDRLFRVDLNPVFPGAPWTRWKEWYGKLDELLTEKYGPPKHQNVSDARIWSASWLIAGGVLVRLIGSSEVSELIYADSTPERLAIEQRAAEKKAAKKPDLDKL